MSCNCTQRRRKRRGRKIKRERMKMCVIREVEEVKRQMIEMIKTN